MEFSINSPVIFIMVAVIIAAVLGQSIFFLVKAYKRGRELGMDVSKLKKIAISATLFTIAPAIAIVISIMALSKDLGLALPWLRLSVVGSLSYEAIAAANASNAMGITLGSGAGLTASQYVTIALVMTLSIMVGIWLVPVVCKKMQSGISSLEKRDKAWSAIFSDSLFMGMIAAFLGLVFCDFGGVFVGDTSGLIPVFIFFSSALVIAICGLLIKITKWSFLNDYALPVSMVAGMALAIPFTAWLG